MQCRNAKISLNEKMLTNDSVFSETWTALCVFYFCLREDFYYATRGCGLVLRFKTMPVE